jgi:hypothetical protein
VANDNHYCSSASAIPAMVSRCGKSAILLWTG